MKINNKLINDTGWINATLTSNFRLYSNTDVCQYRKRGNLIEIRGTVQPINEIPANQNTTIFNLPSGFYDASKSVTSICQGSGMNRWTLTVERDGRVTCSRYGVATNSSIGNNSWLPFLLNFTLDN